MCTTEIVTATAGGALAGAPLGPWGVVAGATLAGTTAAGTQGKGPLAGLKPSTPKPKPIREPSAVEREKQARELRRARGARPGRGRRATIFTQGIASGPANLKQRTGQ